MFHLELSHSNVFNFSKRYPRFSALKCFSSVSTIVSSYLLEETTLNRIPLFVSILLWGPNIIWRRAKRRGGQGGLAKIPLDFENIQNTPWVLRFFRTLLAILVKFYLKVANFPENSAILLAIFGSFGNLRIIFDYLGLNKPIKTETANKRENLIFDRHFTLPYTPPPSLTLALRIPCNSRTELLILDYVKCHLFTATECP